MRFYYYKGDNKKELEKIDRDNIAEDIVKKARCWHDDIEFCEIDFKRIQGEIFTDTSDLGEVKLIPDVYEQSQTYKANIFKATYQNADGMFDIEGQDVRSHNLAATYKASLVYDFDKIKLTATLDEMLKLVNNINSITKITKFECEHPAFYEGVMKIVKGN